MCTNRENIPSEIALLHKKISNYQERERSLLKIQPFIEIVKNLKKNELPKQYKMKNYATEELQQIKEKKTINEINLNDLRENLRKANCINKVLQLLFIYLILFFFLI